MKILHASIGAWDGREFNGYCITENKISTTEHTFTPHEMEEYFQHRLDRPIATVGMLTVSAWTPALIAGHHTAVCSIQGFHFRYVRCGFGRGWFDGMEGA